MEMWQLLRKENRKHVDAINRAWGYDVATLEPEPGFEIQSLLVDGLSRLYGSNWAPPFKTLAQVRAEAI